MSSAVGWPVHGRFLIPQVNDTWNCFQKFCRGKSVSPSEWKQAKAMLYLQYVEYLVHKEAHDRNRSQRSDQTFGVSSKKLNSDKFLFILAENQPVLHTIKSSRF